MKWLWNVKLFYTSSIVQRPTDFWLQESCAWSASQCWVVMRMKWSVDLDIAWYCSAACSSTYFANLWYVQRPIDHCIPSIRPPSMKLAELVQILLLFVDSARAHLRSAAFSSSDKFLASCSRAHLTNSFVCSTMFFSPASWFLKLSDVKCNLFFQTKRNKQVGSKIRWIFCRMPRLILISRWPLCFSDMFFQHFVWDIWETYRCVDYPKWPAILHNL